MIWKQNKKQNKPKKKKKKKKKKKTSRLLMNVANAEVHETAMSANTFKGTRFHFSKLCFLLKNRHSKDVNLGWNGQAAWMYTKDFVCCSCQYLTV